MGIYTRGFIAGPYICDVNPQVLRIRFHVTEQLAIMRGDYRQNEMLYYAIL